MGEGRCEEVLSRTQNELGGKGTDFLAASAPSPGFLPWYPVPRVVYAQSACWPAVLWEGPCAASEPGRQETSPQAQRDSESGEECNTEDGRVTFCQDPPWPAWSRHNS